MSAVHTGFGEKVKFYVYMQPYLSVYIVFSLLPWHFSQHVLALMTTGQCVTLNKCSEERGVH